MSSAPPDNAYETKRAARSAAWQKGTCSLLPHSHNKSEHDLRNISSWEASNNLEEQPLTPSQTVPARFHNDNSTTEGESSRDAAAANDSNAHVSPDFRDIPLRRRVTGRGTSSNPLPGASKGGKGNGKPPNKKNRTFFKHLTPKEPFTWKNQVKRVLFESYINVLLLLIPVGFVCNYVHSISRVASFVINFLAIVPLAAMLGFATEEIALRTGETVGGLLNATFGYLPSLAPLFSSFKD